MAFFAAVRVLYAGGGGLLLLLLLTRRNNQYPEPEEGEYFNPIDEQMAGSFTAGQSAGPELTEPVQFPWETVSVPPAEGIYNYGPPAGISYFPGVYEPSPVALSGNTVSGQELATYGPAIKFVSEEEAIARNREIMEAREGQPRSAEAQRVLNVVSAATAEKRAAYYLAARERELAAQGKPSTTTTNQKSDPQQAIRAPAPATPQRQKSTITPPKPVNVTVASTPRKTTPARQTPKPTTTSSGRARQSTPSRPTRSTANLLNAASQSGTTGSEARRLLGL